jgi:hypothetical protein
MTIYSSHVGMEERLLSMLLYESNKAETNLPTFQDPISKHNMLHLVCQEMLH